MTMKNYQYEVATSGSSFNTNEDTCGGLYNVFWVFDGATPISKNLHFDTQSDATWYVKNFEKELIKVILQSKASSLRELLKESVFQLKNSVEKNYPFFSSLSKTEIPSAAIALVLVNDQIFEYFILGDCSIAHYNEHKEVEIITDNRVRSFSEKSLNVYIELKAKGYSEVQSKELLHRTLLENRKRLNNKDGYPIMTIDGEALNYGIHGLRKINKGDRILIFSDGYERIFNLFNLYDIKTIFENKMALPNSIKQLREIENDDKNKCRYPRIKKSDDASAVLYSHIV